jgi:hypothetical protein
VKLRKKMARLGRRCRLKIVFERFGHSWRRMRAAKPTVLAAESARRRATLCVEELM